MKAYVKDSSTLSNGSAITYAATSHLVLSPDGTKLYYQNGSNAKAYVKNSSDLSDGSAITSDLVFSICVSNDGLSIVYSNGSQSDKLYKKNTSDSSNGSAITPSSAGSSSFCQFSNDDNWIFYRRPSLPDTGLWKKSASSVDF